MKVDQEAIRSRLEEAIDAQSRKHVSRAPSSDFYIRTYPLQLAEFHQLKGSWTVDHVLMRFSSVYGWMPRGIQAWNAGAVSELVSLLNSPRPNEEDLVRVASRCINNSMVGASKFLHFFDPDCFPIFDSVVASMWWPSTSQAITLSRYRLYWCGVMKVSDTHSRAAQAWAKSWMGYEVTGIRAIEAQAFYTQRRIGMENLP